MVVLNFLLIKQILLRSSQQNASVNPTGELRNPLEKGIFHFWKKEGGRCRGPPEGWQDLETELLPLPAALPECDTRSGFRRGEETRGCSGKWGSIVLGQIWAQLAQGEKLPWGAWPHLSRSQQGGAGFAGRAHPGGDWEGQQRPPASVWARRCRGCWGGRAGPLGLAAGAGQGAGLAGSGGAGGHCPGSLAPGTGQGHACQRPERAQGATEGRDKACTHLGWGGGADTSWGTHGAVSVSQKQHRLSLASPDPGSGWELQIGFFFFFFTGFKQLLENLAQTDLKSYNIQKSAPLWTPSCFPAKITQAWSTEYLG